MRYGEGLTKLLRITILACDNAAVPIPDLWLEHPLDESLRDTDPFNQVEWKEASVMMSVA